MPESCVTDDETDRVHPTAMKFPADPARFCITDVGSTTTRRFCPIARVVAGGLDLSDVLDLDPHSTIVVLAGFGRQTMSDDVRRQFDRHQGGLALLDGTTQLRVGVRRPVVILPDTVPAE